MAAAVLRLHDLLDWSNEGSKGVGSTNEIAGLMVRGTLGGGKFVLPFQNRLGEFTGAYLHDQCGIPLEVIWTSDNYDIFHDIETNGSRASVLGHLEAGGKIEFFQMDQRARKFMDALGIRPDQVVNPTVTMKQIRDRWQGGGIIPYLRGDEDLLTSAIADKVNWRRLSAALGHPDPFPRWEAADGLRAVPAAISRLRERTRATRAVIRPSNLASCAAQAIIPIEGFETSPEYEAWRRDMCGRWDSMVLVDECIDQKKFDFSLLVVRKPNGERKFIWTGQDMGSKFYGGWVCEDDDDVCPPGITPEVWKRTRENFLAKVQVQISWYFLPNVGGRHWLGLDGFGDGEGNAWECECNPRLTMQAHTDRARRTLGYKAARARHIYMAEGTHWRTAVDKLGSLAFDARGPRMHRGALIMQPMAGEDPDSPMLTVLMVGDNMEAVHTGIEEAGRRLGEIGT